MRTGGSRERVSTGRSNKEAQEVGEEKEGRCSRPTKELELGWDEMRAWMGGDVE